MLLWVVSIIIILLLQILIRDFFFKGFYITTKIYDYNNGDIQQTIPQFYSFVRRTSCCATYMDPVSKHRLKRYSALCAFENEA